MAGEDDPKQADPTAPAPLPQPSPHPTGPWDIVLHIVARFPTFALTIGVVGVLFWGSGYIITQSTKAQEELAEARGQIAQERGAHQDALAALSIEANARISAKETLAQAAIDEARKAQAAADVTVALAEAKALAAVQDTLIETSERIQALVAGQLSSMEELERVRTTTAGELNRQLEDLGKRRKELETELLRRQAEIDDKNQELKLANVTVPLDILFRSVDTEHSYGIADEAANLVKVVDVADEAQLALLLDKLQSCGDHTVSAAVYFAIYQETERQDWLNRALKEMTPFSQIETDWLRQVDPARQMSPESWGQMAGLALDQIDQGISEEGRTSVILDFLNWQLPYELLSDPSRMDRANLWRFVVACVDDLREGRRYRYGALDLRALDVLMDVAPAAAHVWAYRLSQNDENDQEDEQHLSSILQRFQEFFQVDAVPSDDLMAFWTDSALIYRAADYAHVGTSPMYERYP